MKLKQALQEFKLKESDKIFVYIYGKSDSAQKPFQVADIDASILKREVLLVQPNQGGKEYKYKLYQFVVK